MALRKEGTDRLYNTVDAKGGLEHRYSILRLGMSHVIAALISKWEPSD
jgi:hypothetical protein